MKRIIFILMTLLLIFAIFGCNSEDTNTNTSSTQSELDASTTDDNDEKEQYIPFNYTKNGVDEFYTLFQETMHDYDMKQFLKEKCYNVTPQEVSEATDAKIFKFFDNSASFVLIDNEIYEICICLGGYGFINAVPCDFDGDGSLELLVASSWGSGLHRSEISVFDLTDKSFEIYYSTQDLSSAGNYIELVVQSKENNDGAVTYELYSVDYESALVGDNFTLAYKIIELHGIIENVDGVPTFKQTTNE